MKPVLKAKLTNLLGKKAGISSDCGRMKYWGIDMAFIYVRGKRMLTMSEIARKLYPQWPRTTLYDRMKQMNLRRHTCSAREIVKVLSVNGVAKQGIHCTLISKEDLDAFSTVYKLNPSVTGEEKSSSAATEGNAETGADKKQSRTQPKPKNSRASHQKKPFARAKESGSTRNAVLNLTKQRDKSGTRVVKGGRNFGHKRHVSLGINKASNNRQVHVANKTAQSQQHSPSKQLNGIRKRKLISVSKPIEKATKRPRKERVTSSPSTSDCASLDNGSLDSGISLDTPGSRSKTDGKSSQNRQRVDKGEPRGTKRKNKSVPKLKDSKLKRDGLKMKMKGRKLKNHKSGVKRKSGKVKRSKRVEKENGFKKGKVRQCNKGGSDTITKEFIMKMDLKNMNDNDLINSFSLTSSPFSTPDRTPGSEEPSYHVKLMPVKPVWRVNSSFKFISNFLLPPSLVVRDGELKPACSMVCSPGQRPPSAHPVWKWKIGEPVIGNRTEISYRMKKVKCVD